MPKIKEKLRPIRDSLILQLSTGTLDVDDIANIFNTSRTTVYEIIKNSKVEEGKDK